LKVDGGIKVKLAGKTMARRTILEHTGKLKSPLDGGQKATRAIGLDLSDAQLAHARALSRSATPPLLVQPSAESLPFRTDTFDIVSCDQGATVFAAPEQVVSEVSRVLRPEGVFAFSMSTPIPIAG
jgi:ubiquinone/menaquinone biosynthesis C-methylase UbiE